MQVFGSMHFVLPKSMCSLVEQLIMNFYGQALRFTNTPLKFLGNLYVSLKMGRLGIRRGVDWNYVAILGHIWAMF